MMVVVVVVGIVVLANVIYQGPSWKDVSIRHIKTVIHSISVLAFLFSSSS